MKTYITASTNIKSIDYNEEEKTLVVEFAKGGKYKYFDVPEEIPADMILAKSAGKFFQENIKNAFKFERV
jgi:hypothetical protein